MHMEWYINKHTGIFSAVPVRTTIRRMAKCASYEIVNVIAPDVAKFVVDFTANFTLFNEQISS